MKENTNIPKGYKQTKLGVIPEEWTIEKLEDLCSIKGEYGINAAAVSYDINLPTYLRITDIDEQGNFINKGKKSVNDPDYKKFILEENDIVFARTGNTTGKTYLHKKENGELIFAGFLIRFRPNPLLVSPKFIKLYTNTSKYWSWVKVYSMRSGQPGINGKEYSKLSIPLPPLPEQKAIAKILSTWDKAISNQQLLIDKYKLKKKGLMQKLLAPKKEWKEVRLKEIGSIITGNTPKTSDKDNYGDNFLFVSPVDIGKIKYISETEKGLSNVGFNISRKLPKGSICFVCIGSTIGKIGIASKELATNQQINSIVVNEKYNNEFIYYSLSFYSKKIKLIAGEQAVPLINKTDFSNVKIPIQPNKETQTKIANILSSADKEISILEQQLSKLKEQKKGLMQVLLTGEKRVLVN